MYYQPVREIMSISVNKPQFSGMLVMGRNCTFTNGVDDGSLEACFHEARGLANKFLHRRRPSRPEDSRKSILAVKGESNESRSLLFWLVASISPPIDIVTQTRETSLSPSNPQTGSPLQEITFLELRKHICVPFSPLFSSVSERESPPL
jgi:hypothetical protein